jgi:DNA-directed RNA polymerase specialized sigma24 family protein
VEEALQDTFLALWESAGRFRGEAAVATWVFQIAHNIAARGQQRREALDLFFRQGFAAQEIALILGVPPGTVRSRLSYARKALRQELSEAPESAKPSCDTGVDAPRGEEE